MRTALAILLGLPALLGLVLGGIVGYALAALRHAIEKERGCSCAPCAHERRLWREKASRDVAAAIPGSDPRSWGNLPWNKGRPRLLWTPTPGLIRWYH